MYNQPIFLTPVFQERIWGGQKLKTEFNYDIPYERTGEAWVISAHPNGPSVIMNGDLKGKTLQEAWNEHGDLFNKPADNDGEYPLLVKILDANADLSVQVHPDDTFAQDVEGRPYGKTECWYVLSAGPGAEIIMGHHAGTRAELENLMDNGDWDTLLKRVNVQKGDFIHVPSGSIHAIGEGIVILETQQSSDITYRVYDHDRVDANGQKRELHLDRAKQVTTVPHQTTQTEQTEEVFGDLTVKKLVEDKYFTVCHWKLTGYVRQKMNHDYVQVSVIEGKAAITVDGKTFGIEKGTNFILPNGVEEYELSGEAEFIVSWV